MPSWELGIILRSVGWVPSPELDRLFHTWQRQKDWVLESIITILCFETAALMYPLNKKIKKPDSFKNFKRRYNLDHVIFFFQYFQLTFKFKIHKPSYFKKHFSFLLKQTSFFGSICFKIRSVLVDSKCQPVTYPEIFRGGAWHNFLKGSLTYMIH